MSQKAIVAGATGLVGKELVQLLLEDASYSNVTIVVRRPTGWAHPKIQERVVDFEHIEQAPLDFTGADVFCTLGTTIKTAGSQEAFRKVDYTYPLVLGQLAKAGGAKQFLIITAIGTSATSPFFYSRVKGEVEVALKNLNLPALKIFRPSLLLGHREEFRLGEKISVVISPLLSPLLIGPFKKYRAIHARSVAKAMLVSAQKDIPGITIYESDQMADLSQTM